MNVVHFVIYLHTRDSYLSMNVTIFIRFPVKQAEIFGYQCLMFTCTFFLTRLGWNYTVHCFTSQVAVEIPRGLHSHCFHFVSSTIVTLTCSCTSKLRKMRISFNDCLWKEQLPLLIIFVKTGANFFQRHID